MIEVLIGLVVLACGLGMALVMPLVALARSTRAARLAEESKSELDRLRVQVEAARREIVRLSRIVEGAPPQQSAEEPAATTADSEAEARGAPSGPLLPDQPLPPPVVEAPLETASSSFPASEGAVSGPAASAGPLPPAPPPPSDEPGVRAPPAAHPTRVESLEERIGSRWLLYVALASLIVGTSYFVKYAFENQWITPAMRVAFGGIAGGLLVEAGKRFAARGLSFFGQMLAGGGIVILYLSVYAAFTFYGLIGQGPAFALMVGVTVLAALLADREASQPLALLAVTGGFLTPFLVSTGRDAQVALFTYDAILVAGTMYLARRRGWPVLNLVSFLLTWVTLAGWLATFYRPSKWLRTELFFTLFCAMFVYIQRHTWRLRTPAARRVGMILGIAPLAYHGASIGLLALQPLWMLVYLIAVTAAVSIASGHFRSPVLRVVVLALVVLPLYGWIARYRGAAWLAPGTIAIIAIYGIHLMASLRAASDVERLPTSEIVLIHANGGWLCGALYILYINHAAVWLGTIVAALAAWYGVLALALRSRAGEVWVHHLALAFALAAVAVAVQFDGAWVTVGWAADGAAFVWIGLRLSRNWMRVAGGALLAIAFFRLADQLLGVAPAAYFPIANPRLVATGFVIALLYMLAALHRGRLDLPGRGEIERAVLLVAAHALTLLLITSEIDLVFRARAWAGSAAGGAGAVTSAELGRQVSLSSAWAAYALALVAVGIRRRYAPIRYFAITVFAVTAGKVFLVDLARLDRIWRILSFIVFGLLLLGASYLYQRFSASDECNDTAARDAVQGG